MLKTIMNKLIMRKTTLLILTAVMFVSAWIACQSFLSFIMWDNLFLIPLDQWQWYARTALSLWIVIYISLSISMIIEL